MYLIKAYIYSSSSYMYSGKVSMSFLKMSIYEKSPIQRAL
jgi:hypothetical protein